MATLIWWLWPPFCCSNVGSIVFASIKRPPKIKNPNQMSNKDFRCGVVNSVSVVAEWTSDEEFKDGAYYCYCAYVLRIARYSGFL